MSKISAKNIAQIGIQKMNRLISNRIKRIEHALMPKKSKFHAIPVYTGDTEEQAPSRYKQQTHEKLGDHDFIIFIKHFSEQDFHEP